MEIGGRVPLQVTGVLCDFSVHLQTCWFLLTTAEIFEQQRFYHIDTLDKLQRVKVGLGWKRRDQIRTLRQSISAPEEEDSCPRAAEKAKDHFASAFTDIFLLMVKVVLLAATR